MGDLLTVGVATKNRPGELARCIQSLRALNEFDLDIIIVDDGSEQPIEPYVRSSSDLTGLEIRFYRWEASRNLMAARNWIVQHARGDIVLMLDDDAFVLDGTELRDALMTLRSDPTLGSIAFPERDAYGSLKPKQPGRRSEPSLVTHFYGYAHAVKTDLFLSVGGYREVFGFYHEESDYCKRALDQGAWCLYWPAAMIAHVPSSIDRNARDLRRFKLGTRNRIFDGIFNEPFPLMVLSTLREIATFAWNEKRYRARHGKSQTGGPLWPAKELRSKIKLLWRGRSPLKWKVYIQWKWVRTRNPTYMRETRQEPTIHST